MANEYLYGAYGHMGETVAQSAVQAGTTPVYIGTAPVNLVRGFADAGVINEPIKLSNMIDAQRKLGYAADWGTFTLCEVMNAHFNNTLGNIGPIYVINVLDPSAGKHRKATETTQQLSFTGGRAEFASSTIILDTMTIAKSDGGDYAEGTDYAVDYNFTKGTVIITSLIADSPLTGTLTASFYEVDDSAIEDDDIIGGVTAGGEYSGLSSIALLYPEQFAVCNLIAAPGWSHSPAVYNAMLTASQKINGHWDAFVVADLPLVSGSSAVGQAEVDEAQVGATAVDTIEKAIAWKKSNAFDNERSKVYWPQGIDNLGNVYHLSTLAVVELMRADFSHNSVPMETCGNKAIPIIKQYFGANATNRGFSQQEGKELTQNGISTAVAWGGEWGAVGRPHRRLHLRRRRGSPGDLRRVHAYAHAHHQRLPEGVEPAHRRAHDPGAQGRDHQPRAGEARRVCQHGRAAGRAADRVPREREQHHRHHERRLPLGHRRHPDPAPQVCERVRRIHRRRLLCLLRRR